MAGLDAAAFAAWSAAAAVLMLATGLSYRAYCRARRRGPAPAPTAPAAPGPPPLLQRDAPAEPGPPPGAAAGISPDGSAEPGPPPGAAEDGRRRIPPAV